MTKIKPKTAGVKLRRPIVNHRHDMIFREGLPDVPESRPHSRANSSKAQP